MDDAYISRETLPHHHHTFTSSMESHSSSSMFISEIPVRLRADKTIRWVTELTASTTVDDVIQTILQPSKEDPSTYALYICLGRQRQLLSNTSRIYHIVARHGSVRRLCFELRQIPIKKRVRFADQVPEEEMTTMSLEKRLEQLKENFQKHVQRKQECYTKRSSILKRPILNKRAENMSAPICVQTATIKHLSRSSSESGISSCSSHENLTLETLV